MVLRILLFTLLLLALPACDDESRSSATPTPTVTATVTSGTAPTVASATATPFPNTPAGQAAAFGAATPLAIPAPTLVDGIPAGAVGPLLVYLRHLKQVERDGVSGISTVFEVVTYDVGAGRAIASFTVGDARHDYGRFLLAGRQLLLAVTVEGAKPTQQLFALDGALIREVARPPVRPDLGYFIVSLDGTLLADSVEDGIRISELHTGRDLVRTEATALPEGTLWPVAWAPGNRWVVAQLVNPHSLWGLWLLSSDGTLRMLEPGGYEAQWRVAPDGRFAALRTVACPDASADPSPPICALAVQRFVVRDLATNRDIATVELPDPASLNFYWSLDGAHLLYSLQRPAVGVSRDDVRAWIEAAQEWHVLDLRTGKSSAISAGALARGEVPPWRVTLDCTQFSTGTRYIQPFAFGLGARTGSSCDRLSLDGRLISDGRPVEVIGVIQVPAQ